MGEANRMEALGGLVTKPASDRSFDVAGSTAAEREPERVRPVISTRPGSLIRQPLPTVADVPTGDTPIAHG